MKYLIIHLILIQYCLTIESNKKINFLNTVSIQCINFDDPSPHMNIFLSVESSGFNEPQQFVHGFKGLNFLTTLCTIRKDDDVFSKQILCNVSIVEYGISRINFLDEEPKIEGVELYNWDRVPKVNLGSCYMPYTYHINHINYYSIKKNNDEKFIEINAVIKKNINITGEENTALTLYTYLEIDGNINTYEKSKCDIFFNGAKDEDPNGKMICNVTTQGKEAMFVSIVPLEHSKNYYVYIDISDEMINLTEASLFISIKFWLFIITFLMLCF